MTGAPSVGGASRSSRWFLTALLVAYALKQLAFVIGFPPFTGHDEVAHFAYLRIVATEGRIPILLQDTLPEDLAPYRRFALDWSEGEPGYLYLANHPPLYYGLMTPVYWLSSGWSPVAQQYLLRLAAIPFGLLIVWFASRLASTLFPGDPFLGTTVPTVVALQPQISYEAAMVNNDILAIALSSCLLWVMAVAVRQGCPPRVCLSLGMLLGLGLLAKGTTVTLIPVIAAALVMGTHWSPRQFLHRAALVAAPVLLLTSPWYLFLYLQYGNLSGFDQIQTMQQHWNHTEATFPELLYSLDFVIMRFRETWGEFGWRRLPLGSPLLIAIATAMSGGVVGLMIYAAVPATPENGSGDPVQQPVGWQIQVLWLLVLTCAISYLAVVQFGTSFALTQARYFFPAVNAAAVLLMLGLRTLIPRAWHAHGALAIAVAMVALNVVIFAWYVVPFYPQW